MPVQNVTLTLNGQQQRNVCKLKTTYHGHTVLLEDGTHVADTSLKDKALPLQAWTGPEDSRRLRIPDFKTIST